jgi:HK97 gp10 family phage protein
VNPANWNRYERELRAKMRRRMTAAAIVVRDSVKASMMVRYPPASSPGSPPHIRTDRLRSTIAYEVTEGPRGIEARVGTNVEYALALELGTSRMAARPFLRPALARERARIERILRGTP